MPPASGPKSTIRRLSVGALAVTVALVVAACGGTDGSGDTGSITAPSTAAAAGTATTGVEREPALDPLAGITIVAELGYPRDLLERGRVNLVVTRDDEVPLVITEKRLVADHFAPPPPEARRLIVPSGRRVALQTEFGTVENCASDSPVTAVLEVIYTYDDSPAALEGAIPLADASLFDELRARFCAVEAIEASNTIEIIGSAPTAGAVAATVEITRTDGTDELVVEAITGTVLFGVTSPIAKGEPGRTLGPDATRLAVPITVDVNRCDPHAVAETTKKFGIEFWISINGADAHPVPIPIGSIRAELEALLEECQRSSDS